jgi:hypothetical protein
MNPGKHLFQSLKIGIVFAFPQLNTIELGYSIDPPGALHWIAFNDL